MLKAVFEAVPNLSEGRAPEKIAAFGDAARPHLADVHSDRAHNRTVLTLLGDGDGLREACSRLAEAAFASIDVSRHDGEHPFIGALDVTPFVPLDGGSLEEAAGLARDFGEEIGDRFRTPVFLYGAAGRESGDGPAATLREIRRGGLDGLRERIASGSAVPAYGPAVLHPTAGAAAVGARPPLIAYNVNLDIDDRAASRRIARRVRDAPELPRVRALGLRVGDPDSGTSRAQVSMNVEDFRAAPLDRVFRFVERAAADLGAGVRGSEIVGLLPAVAAWPGMQADLRLARPPRTIEAALRSRCS